MRSAFVVEIERRVRRHHLKSERISCFNLVIISSPRCTILRRRVAEAAVIVGVVLVLVCEANSC